MHADGDRLLRLQFPKPVEAFLNRLAIHKLHREPMLSGIFAGRVDLDQIRMVERGRSNGLVVKAGDKLAVHRESGAERLDGDKPL